MICFDQALEGSGTAAWCVSPDTTISGTFFIHFFDLAEVQFDYELLKRSTSRFPRVELLAHRAVQSLNLRVYTLYTAI